MKILIILLVIMIMCNNNVIVMCINDINDIEILIIICNVLIIMKWKLLMIM